MNDDVNFGGFLSRAEVRRILVDPSFSDPSLEDYRGDLQMHSEWSDGAPTVQQIADACLQRGYRYAAVTDHSYGLRIAGGMSMAEAAQQRHAIDQLNARLGTEFRLFQGIEANIDAAGQLDLSDDEAATFDVVLAAPHSRLRRNEDQTDRMLAAVAHPAVRILAHPRGRITGSRAGVITLTNEGAKAVEAQVRLEDWDRAEDGTNRWYPLGTLPGSCGRLVQIFQDRKSVE